MPSCLTALCKVREVHCKCFTAWERSAWRAPAAAASLRQRQRRHSSGIWRPSASDKQSFPRWARSQALLAGRSECVPNMVQRTHSTVPPPRQMMVHTGSSRQLYWQRGRGGCGVRRCQSRIPSPAAVGGRAAASNLIATRLCRQPHHAPLPYATSHMCARAPAAASPTAPCEKLLCNSTTPHPTPLSFTPPTRPPRPAWRAH